MLTQGVDGVGGDEGLWVSLAELARMRGVSKQAIAKRVARLEAQHAVTVRPGDRGSRLVNVAEFDKAAGDTTDAVRQLNGAPQKVAVTESGALSQQQTRRARYAADLSRLELEERLGRLLPIKDVEDAMTRCAEAMVRVIDQISSRADDVSAAVARDGSQGARAFLRDLARDLRVRLGDEMRLLQRSAPANEDMPDSEDPAAV